MGETEWCADFSLKHLLWEVELTAFLLAKSNTFKFVIRCWSLLFVELFFIVSEDSTVFFPDVISTVR